MALWEINFTITDDKSVKATHSFYLPESFVIDDDNSSPNLARRADYFAQVMAAIIDQAIGGVITRITVTRTVDLPPGMKTIPIFNSDVEQGILATYRTEGGKTFQNRIPTFFDDHLTDGGGVVQDDPLAVPFLPLYTITIADIFDMLTNAVDVEIGADWTDNPVDSRGEGLIALIDVKEQFRRRRR